MKNLWLLIPVTGVTYNKQYPKTAASDGESSPRCATDGNILVIEVYFMNGIWLEESANRSHRPLL
jgi:hypothetical protein